MKKISNSIIVPRWLLTVKYGMIMLIGLSVFINTAPSLTEVTGASATAVWGMALAATSTACMITSITPKWEVAERWCVLVLSSLLLGYAFAPIQLVINGDMDKATYSIIALTISLVACSRTWQLLRKTGARKNG